MGGNIQDVARERRVAGSDISEAGDAQPVEDYVQNCAKHRRGGYERGLLVVELKVREQAVHEHEEHAHRDGRHDPHGLKVLLGGKNPHQLRREHDEDEVHERDHNQHGIARASYSLVFPGFYFPVQPRVKRLLYRGVQHGQNHGHAVGKAVQSGSPLPGHLSYHYPVA